MIGEEYQETLSAINNSDAEEVVDGLIDMCVFAIGTLDVMGVDANQAWNRVYNANVAKNVGVKEGRPNKFGLPDLIKPEGWVAPDHTGNHGDLDLAIGTPPEIVVNSTW
jgi:predicted HAD superfamily Cof-like phosphohydrolase